MHEKTRAYIDSMNESVKPLIQTVMNYFVETNQKMTDDQYAAVAALSIALKNWEKIEQEFIDRGNPEKKDDPESFFLRSGGQLKEDKGIGIQALSQSVLRRK